MTAEIRSYSEWLCNVEGPNCLGRSDTKARGPNDAAERKDRAERAGWREYPEDRHACPVCIKDEQAVLAFLDSQIQKIERRRPGQFGEVARQYGDLGKGERNWLLSASVRDEEKDALIGCIGEGDSLDAAFLELMLARPEET